MKQPLIEGIKLDQSLEALNNGLEELWSIHEGKLFKSFKFKNFVEAMGFMTRAAILAEKADHHPEWSNVYNKVDVHLITHSSSGITQLDFELAKNMQNLVRQI